MRKPKNLVRSFLRIFKLATLLLSVVLMPISLACAQGSSDLFASDLDVIRVDTNLITVNVSVTDTRNRHLQGLKREDFQVTDEDKPVKPEFFDSEGPASIVFLIDVSSSMKGEKWKNLRAGLKRFLKNGRAGSDYTLIAFNEKPQLIVSAVNAEQLWQNFDGLRPEGETALYDALLLGLKMLERVPQRHRALVLLSDGEDTSSHAGLRLVEQETLANRATIYPVGILLDSRFVPQAKGKRLLNEMATATGGFVLFPKADEIAAALELISTDVSGQYSFSYYPPDQTAGWRRVQVSIDTNSHRFNLRYQARYLMR
jgi:Ca-activated chloride channel family protein